MKQLYNSTLGGITFAINTLFMLATMIFCMVVLSFSYVEQDVLTAIHVMMHEMIDEYQVERWFPIVWASPYAYALILYVRDMK